MFKLICDYTKTIFFLMRHNPIPTGLLKITRLNININEDVGYRSSFELLLEIQIGVIILGIYLAVCRENKYTYC